MEPRMEERTKILRGRGRGWEEEEEGGERRGRRAEVRRMGAWKLVSVSRTRSVGFLSEKCAGCVRSEWGRGTAGGD